MKQEYFEITGMTCSACSNRVEKTVSKVEGVGEVNVNLLKNDMSVTYDDTATTAEKIIAAVEKIGYHATLHNEASQDPHGFTPSHHDRENLELQEMKQRLFVSILFGAPLFYLSMGHMFQWPFPEFFLGDANAINYAFTQFLLLIPVVFVNFKYFRTGFKTLFAGAPNMDSLIAIGSGAAIIFGIYAIYRIGAALGRSDMETAHRFAMDLYFESAAMILALITLGKFFEAKAKRKTTDAIARLVDLAPKKARVLRDGVEAMIPGEDVRVGDVLIVKAGESIPVDGVITEGNALVDESALTGESMPVEKETGARVTGATINKSGHFLMRATKVGNDTTLAQIIKLVDEATSSKAAIAQLADKISGVFVPVVIVIAVCATLVWSLLGYGPEFALSIGISVLVISCPCALGLATPTAIMVGTGQGAANGILIKSAEAIEIAQSIRTVVLDKTGTVTEGKPAVTDIVTTRTVTKTELLTLAASLEKLSEHPLAHAIVQEANKHGFSYKKVLDFIQMPGRGISGNIDGISYSAGNLKLLVAKGINVDSLREQVERFAAEGKTVLYFLRENELIGVIAVADKIKPTSRRAVSELEAMGLEVIMLTGDNARTAGAVQRQAGIRKVIAEVLPQDKEFEIRNLQERGQTVAMVGDGINDAPALARADLGIAIGAGTDIAIESADIVLMKSDLLDVVGAIRLGKAVMRNIRQNLFWAFIYNIIGIPVAAGVFYGIAGVKLNPMIAAAAMSLSSISVVTNALRLRFFKPEYGGHGKEDPINNDFQNNDILTLTDLERSDGMKKTIRIEGMSCNHCKAAVEKALDALTGVSGAKVDLAAKTAVIDVDESIADAELTSAVTEAGYEVVGIECDAPGKNAT